MKPRIQSHESIPRRFIRTEMSEVQQIGTKSMKFSLAFGFLLGLYSTLKIELICSSETSANIQTTRRYIQEDGNIHWHGDYC
jgi:hypothetical protein